MSAMAPTTADKRLLFICEKYYLRFYRPIAERLSRSGFRPIWIALDGPDQWDHDYLDAARTIETLFDADAPVGDDIDALCRFEHAVFEQPNVFEANYSYTVNVVRSYQRARRMADVWYRTTLALLERFAPRAVFVWNGRYLPYSAVSAACESVGQLLLTSEIGWVPGTVFVDRGGLSPDTTDLAGRQFESAPPDDLARADAFLEDYTTRKATMVAQRPAVPAEVRRQLLGDNGTFLLLYGCQVDWDTNVVIGARRFRSNEAAVSFLMEALRPIPGGRLIVKTHPLDAATNTPRLRAIVEDRGAVVADIHPHALIEAADCVAVRNSTLGFEALCYGKPLIALEVAKYRHPGLTLAAESVEDVAQQLQRIVRGDRSMPDRDTLRRFVLHLLDRYLVPAAYDYFFDPAKLELLSHLDRNVSHASLEELLNRAAAPRVVADPIVTRALAQCAVSRTPFLSRQRHKLAGWLS